MSSRHTMRGDVATKSAAAGATTRRARGALPAKPLAVAAKPYPPAAGSAAAASTSLSQQAYDEIKEKILSLEFGPGQFLNEHSICEMLALSRTPVHHAVHRLKAEGLLDVIPRKGILIRPDSLNEVLALLEARLAVEPAIAALAAERVTAAQIDEIRMLLAQSARITDQRYRQQFMATDRAFHALVASSAGNAILAETIRPMHERSTRIWHLQVWQANDLELTQAEHVTILDAVARRDKAAAARAMQQHLASLQRRIMRGR